MNLVQDDKRIQIVPVAIFFILFGAYMNMLSSKVKVLFLIKWSDRSPQIMLTNETRMVNRFWACSPISIEHMSVLVCVFRSTPNHSLKYRCLFKMSNQIKPSYLGYEHQLMSEQAQFEEPLCHYAIGLFLSFSW